MKPLKEFYPWDKSTAKAFSEEIKLECALRDRSYTQRKLRKTPDDRVLKKALTELNRKISFLFNEANALWNTKE